MYTQLDIDEVSGSSPISTGHLPPDEEVATLVAAAYERYQSLDEGKVADYIPALARTPRELFGVCVVGIEGGTFAVGDTAHEFSIQSISKPFVFALVCQAVGSEEARRKIGVNATGLPFNSVMAIELNDDRTMNPMVNAGAIATTSLAPGETAEAKWRFIQEGLSRFAGRGLSHRHGGVRVGGGDEPAEPWHRQAAGRLWPPVFRCARSRPMFIRSSVP